MNLKSLWYDTRVHVGFTLFLVWLLAIWNFRTDTAILKIILYPLLAIAVIQTTDLAWTRIRSRKFYLPTASVVSGFLIGLILAPTEPFYVIILASILASLSKQFIATGVRQHIFNPAAFGIMTVNFIFGTTVSWWGVSWGWLPVVIFAPLMIRILWKLKRLFLPLSFLIVYFVYLLPTSSFDIAARTVIDPTVLLFALVMLPEPITSPITGYFKYLFGALVAILAIVISVFTSHPEIFLPALLLSNLGAFGYLRYKAYSKKNVQ